MNEQTRKFATDALYTLALLSCVLTFTLTGHDGLAQTSFGALAMFIGPTLAAAVAPQIPRPVVAAGALALALGATQLVGCGASLPVVLGTSELIAKFGCDGAAAICTATGNASTLACEDIAAACAFVPGVASTSGGEAL